MIKVLSIGNSFSQDATRYLEEIAQGRIFSRNCYIGGCSLEMHWNNIAAMHRCMPMKQLHRIWRIFQFVRRFCERTGIGLLCSR